MTPAARILDVTALPTSAEYQLLLRTAADLSHTLGLVLGPTRDAPGMAPSLARQLAVFPHLIVSSAEWPGTVASEEYTCIQYPATHAVVDVLAAATGSILDLDGADGMPFDPHFLRDDRSPVLLSVTGDARVWFELQPEELAAFPASVVSQLGLRPPPGPAITHPSALWGYRADCIVESPVGADPVAFEQLPSRDLGDGRFEVCCIPYNAPDLALGDRVTAVKDRERWVRAGKASQSGRAVVEIEVAPLAVDINEVVESLRLGSFRFEVAGDSLIVVDAVDDDEIRAIEDAVFSTGTATVGLAVGVR
jgi:hypothetical protein